EDVMAGYTNVTPTCIDVTLVCDSSEDNDFTNEPLLCINGTKIINCDGAILEGWIIRLKDAAGVELDSIETDGNGDYSFCGLEPGSYRVCEDVMAGYTNVTPTCIDVTLVCDSSEDNDFTNEPLLCINGTKFDDCTGEGLEGWVITLTKPDGSIVTDTT